MNIPNDICKYHPDEPATERCDNCGAPVCRGCITDVRGKRLCPDCVRISGGAALQYSCINHPRERAVTFCSVCGAPLCPACFQLAASKPVCAACKTSLAFNASQTSCAVHPERPAAGLCNICGKPACVECLTEMPNEPGKASKRPSAFSRMMHRIDAALHPRIDEKILRFRTPTQMATFGLAMLALAVVPGMDGAALIAFVVPVGLIAVLMALHDYRAAIRQNRAQPPGLELSPRNRSGIAALVLATAFWVFVPSIAMPKDMDFAPFAILFIIIPTMLIIMGKAALGDIAIPLRTPDRLATAGANLLNSTCPACRAAHNSVQFTAALNDASAASFTEAAQQFLLPALASTLGLGFVILNLFSGGFLNESARTFFDYLGPGFIVLSIPFYMLAMIYWRGQVNHPRPTADHKRGLTSLSLALIGVLVLPSMIARGYWWEACVVGLVIQVFVILGQAWLQV